MSKATATNGWKGLAVALLVTAGLYNAQVQAAPLNLTVLNPDLQVSDLNINYSYDAVAGTGSFTATQTTPYALFSYTADGSSSTEYLDWTYSLSADLDNNGTLTSGSLEIQDGTSNTQLAGDLTAFGYQNDPSGNSDLFEFTFIVTGGALDSDFGSLGGIIMVTDLNSTFDGDITNDFTAMSTSSDTFAAVPVPAAAWLFGSGLLGLAATARRRHA